MYKFIKINGRFIVNADVFSYIGIKKSIKFRVVLYLKSGKSILIGKFDTIEECEKIIDDLWIGESR